MKKYPDWICTDCGEKVQRIMLRRALIATFHIGRCDICGETKPVTQPRDYGWPSPYKIALLKKQLMKDFLTKAAKG